MKQQKNNWAAFAQPLSANEMKKVKGSLGTYYWACINDDLGVCFSTKLECLVVCPSGTCRLFTRFCPL